MNRFKTTGVAVIDKNGSHVKDYNITDKSTGETIEAIRQSNGKYATQIGVRVFTEETIRGCKEHFADWLDSRGPVGVRPERGCLDKDASDSDLWGCCHPAALVIELVGALGSALSGPDGTRLLSVIKKTLDNYGYCDEEGEPDYESARREIDHWVSNEDMCSKEAGAEVRNR